MKKTIVTLLFCFFIFQPNEAYSQQSTERLDSSDGQTVVFSREGGWFIYKAPLDCFALNEYDNLDTFSISINLVTNRASLNLYSERFRSIVAGQRYQVSMLFQGAGRSPSLWRNLQWEGTERGRIGVGNLNASEIMRDISAFASVGLVTEDRAVLGSYSLRGSAAALSSLRTCEREVEVEHPTDPFTGTRE